MATFSKTAQQKTAFTFGFLLVVGFLGIAFFCPSPTPFQYTVFRIVLALAAAGVAAMIPGFISVELGATIRAGGAIAVFVIVYFFSPAALIIGSGGVDGANAIKAKVTGIQRQQLITAYSTNVTSAGPDIGGNDEVAFLSGDAASAAWVFGEDAFGGSAFFIDLDVDEDSLELVGVEVNTIRFRGHLPYTARTDGATRQGATPNLVFVVEVVSPSVSASRVLLANPRTQSYDPFESVLLRKGFLRLMIQFARQGTGRGEFELRFRIRRTTDGHEETLRLPESLEIAFISQAHT